MSKVRLGEPIFRSVQGEGNRTGVLSVWIRFFGCNLKCEGFFQQEPTKPETWKIPDALTNGKTYTSLTGVPILHTGCDSGYSWHPNFKHLAIDKGYDEVTRDIESLLYNGAWTHSLTKNMMDLCFTGGEPMMQQDKLVSVMSGCGVDNWRQSPNYPHCVQIETNGTKPLNQCFIDFYASNKFILNWNVSPKLYTVSGEKDVVNYSIITDYFTLSNFGCLKFVVNDRDECWDELNGHVKELCSLGLDMPIYVMPVGATYEQQSDTKVLSKIANRAIENGYHVSGRLQAVMFGNGVGT